MQSVAITLQISVKSPKSSASSRTIARLHRTSKHTAYQVHCLYKCSNQNWCCKITFQASSFHKFHYLREINLNSLLRIMDEIQDAEMLRKQGEDGNYDTNFGLSPGTAPRTAVIDGCRRRAIRLQKTALGSKCFISNLKVCYTYGNIKKNYDNILFKRTK